MNSFDARAKTIRGASSAIYFTQISLMIIYFGISQNSKRLDLNNQKENLTYKMPALGHKGSVIFNLKGDFSS